MLILFAADCKTENISISRGTCTSSSTSFALICKIKEIKPAIISYIYIHTNIQLLIRLMDLQF